MSVDVEPLTDTEIEAIYAAFEVQTGNEAKTIEGKRRIVGPIYAAVLEVVRKPAFTGPRYGGLVQAEAERERLDVERHAKLLAVAMDRADPPISGDEDDADRAEHRAYAAEIAREYAALVAEESR